MVDLWKQQNLNVTTKTDRYPVPNINNVTSVEQSNFFFSKFDLRQTYYHLLMKEDIEKTIVIKAFLFLGICRCTIWEI